MDPYRIFVRVLFAFAFLHALMRLSGKRLVAKASGLDFVLALILGDMIDDWLWAEAPLSQFVVATGVLLGVQRLVSMACFASRRVGWLAKGEPRPVLREGSLLRPAMRRERMNEKELEEQLRLKRLAREDWSEVTSAWIEASGRLGVLKHEWARTAQRKDLDRLRKDLERLRGPAG